MIVLVSFSFGFAGIVRIFMCQLYDHLVGKMHSISVNL